MFNYKLAIIIPSWNCANGIDTMLESIMSNSFVDWKCFVVDDNSTDNSLDIIKSYHAKDSRIEYKVRDRLPKGAQTCRNIGFALSEGAEYIIWFDSDDIVAPYCFLQRVKYMDEHPNLDFAVFPPFPFKDQPHERDKDSIVYGYRFTEDSLKAMINVTLPMVGWTNIYRRSSCLKYHLIWDETLLSLQDSDFNIQAMLKGCIFNYADDNGDNINPDYFYRVNPNNNSISKKILSKNHFKSNIHLIRKILNSMSPEQLDRYELDLKAYILRFMRIMMSDKESLNALAETNWIQSNVFFYYKLKFWITIYPNSLLLKLLFPNILRYYSLKQRNWISFCNRKIHEIKKG